MRVTSRVQKISYYAAGVISISVLLMIAAIPFLYSDTFPYEDPSSPLTGILLAIAIHLIILLIYIKTLRENRKAVTRDGGYVAVGILLIIFGLIYMDGAIAFSSRKSTMLLSIVMFTSTFCDLVASVMMITVFYLKPKKRKLHKV
jgi:amino acid transporter